MSTHITHKHTHNTQAHTHKYTNTHTCVHTHTRANTHTHTHTHTAGGLLVITILFKAQIRGGNKRWKYMAEIKTGSATQGADVTSEPRC